MKEMTTLTFIVFAVIALAATWTLFILIEEMKWRAPELYSEIGKPIAYFNTPAGYRFVYGFLLRGRYKKRVTDENLKRLCRWFVVLFWAQHAALLVLALILFGERMLT
jgi:hypothetical protein